MLLDNRLQAIVKMVAKGSRVADIGTDHGYLAIELIKRELATFVVAGDKNRGPYEMACRTVSDQAISSEQISVRLGDGLQVLQPGEVDTVCIAGMGGVLMTEIFLAAPDIMTKLDTLILQPMNGAQELRAWLYTNGWHIEAESLAKADDHLYVIIKAKKGTQAMPSALDLLVGPVLKVTKPALFDEHIANLIAKNKRILAGMEKSPAAKDSRRYQALEKLLTELEACAKC